MLWSDVRSLREVHAFDREAVQPVQIGSQEGRAVRGLSDLLQEAAFVFSDCPSCPVVAVSL